MDFHEIILKVFIVTPSLIKTNCQSLNSIELYEISIPSSFLQSGERSLPSRESRLTTSSSKPHSRERLVSSTSYQSSEHHMEEENTPGWNHDHLQHELEKFQDKIRWSKHI